MKRVQMTGPQVEFSEQLHAMKYRQPGETFRDAMTRVAGALTDDSTEFHAFRDILLDMRFMPAGRVQAAMGAVRDTTPYNCFVSGTIPDSFTTRDNEFDSSIMHRAEQAAQTMRMGGGIGYDFSTLRPRGALIRKLQSNSTGPLSFMKIFDAVCRATSSAGHRRGAQMGVLRVDHPDIVEFVNAKHDQETLTGFNISVAVTDEFMEAVVRGSSFDLTFEGEVHSTVDARELWETIMRSTWDWAEPGVLFIDTINRMNNLWYCERIAATNPCAEQPLPPHGACLLGSLNLAKYVTPQSATEGRRTYSLDLAQLAEDIPWIVRAMDNIVDRARYPLPEQEAEARSKRRMGIGVTGMANAIEALGHPYGSAEYLRVQDEVLSLINRCCYRASALLAADRGSFPMYDAEQYLGGQFVQTLDDETYDMIRHHGIRNSHLTSIAPTGTISMCADNVSSGIEPVFSVVTQRPVNTPDGPVIADLEDYGSARHGTVPRLAAEVTAAEHVAVLASASRHVDSAVSKTCNVDGRMPWADFKQIYSDAWAAGCKGLTTFNADGKRMALLTGKTTQSAPAPSEEPEHSQTEACIYDPATGIRSCDQ